MIFTIANWFYLVLKVHLKTDVLEVIIDLLLKEITQRFLGCPGLSKWLSIKVSAWDKQRPGFKSKLSKFAPP